MPFNQINFKEIYHKITLWIFSLGLMIYLFNFNSLQASLIFNQIDLNSPSQLQIDRMENVGERKKFPLLILSGKTITNQTRYESRVSRGEYEKVAPGDIITVYETRDQTRILTKYSVNNLKPFLKLFNYSFSIFFLGEVALFLVMLVLFILTSKSIYEISMGN